MFTNYGDLNEFQLDALREIGNIGSGNAASSLSLMLDKPVDIAMPKIKILGYEEVIQNLGGPERPLVSLLLILGGDVTGMIMFLLHQEFAHMVLSTLTGQEIGEIGSLDEFSGSAMREVGNIMAASYVNAISEMTGLSIELSVPSMSIDMAGAVLSVPAIYYANISDKIIFIEDEFNRATDHASSHILMIPEVGSLQKIMDSLGLGE